MDAHGTDESEEKVEANRKALEFLHSIDFKSLGKTIFTDQLVIADRNDVEIGEMTVSVEETIRKEEVCYLVRSLKYSVLDGVPMGQSVTAYISRGLKTIDLTEHEYSEVDGKGIEKRTTIQYDGDQYIVNKTTCKGDNASNNTERVYTAASMTGYISDGATIILERLMCLKEDIPESAVFLSLDTSLSLVTMTYEKLLDEMYEINGHQVQTIGIQRETKSIFRPVCVETRFLTDGHIAQYLFANTQSRAKLLTMPILTENEEIELTKPEIENLPWQQDMQLSSYFIERKEGLMQDHQAYLRHKPELQAMLKDFLQFVLLRKPDDICKFAASYFGSLSTKKVAPSLSSDTDSVVQSN